MPITRDHAFADGLAFARERRPLFGWRGESARARAGRAWEQFTASARMAKGSLLGPNAWCVNSLGGAERITLERSAVCRGLLRIEKFGDGKIAIGERSYIGDDCLLSAAAGIEIAADVMLAHGVQIFDNDSHPLDPAARAADFASLKAHGDRGHIATAPIRIGAGAWIGFGAIILKGVTIGENAVIGAGAVVTRDVPAGAIAAGNPAAIIKHLDRTDRSDPSDPTKAL